MGEFVTSKRFMSVGENGYVSADDVLYLRKTLYKDGILGKAELNSLLGLAERAPEGDIEWAEFFGEAAADFYLREEMPHDYITERVFADLHSQVTRYGETVTPLVLSMLIRLVDKATATPPAMSRFITEQIIETIKQRSIDPVITENDVALLRVFLYAMGGDGNVAITREEVCLLFDLNDMTICADNHASWSELFVKAVANHLMAQIGYSVPSREEALRQWNWMKDHDINVAGFFKRMVSGGLEALRGVYSEQACESGSSDSLKPENVFDKIAISRGENAGGDGSVDEEKLTWFAERLGRDGYMDDNERAVIAYLRAMNDDLPPVLKSLVGDAA